MLQHPEITEWLRETDESRLAELWHRADQTRRQFVGDEVHLRGLVELSNICIRMCGYCGLRMGNDRLSRYRMTQEEIFECAQQAADFGYGTVVLQAGEDPGIEDVWMAEIIRRIKDETPLAVTLSLGERHDGELTAWRTAGADRYLLRFETSNRRLYDAIHPPAFHKTESDRVAILHTLKTLGYEVGSGVMIGIPGQSYDDLARDIELFGELDLDMIGVGPFLSHPETPLGQSGGPVEISDEDQVPSDELTTYKVMALARLVCPKANIPSTTALATLNSATGRELGLQRGGNVVMPNLTPRNYRALYEIYPDKACVTETAEDCNSCIKGRIRALDRQIGTGRGGSPNYAPDDATLETAQRAT